MVEVSVEVCTQRIVSCVCGNVWDDASWQPLGRLDVFALMP